MDFPSNIQEKSLEMFKFGFIIVCVVVSQLNSNPIESSERPILGHENLFQGDIKLTEEQQDIIDGKVKVGRTGMLDTRNHWPKNSRGIVEIPYQINPNAGFSECLKFLIFVSIICSSFSFIQREMKLVSSLMILKKLRSKLAYDLFFAPISMTTLTLLMTAAVIHSLDGKEESKICR